MITPRFFIFREAVDWGGTLKKRLEQIKNPTKLARLKVLSERLHGAYPDFMSREDLRKVRESEKLVASAITIEIEDLKRAHSKYIKLSNDVWSETVCLHDLVCG